MEHVADGHHVTPTAKVRGVECESPIEQIACAIRENADVGLFDVFAYLVVPGLVGLVTLIVAVASFSVAQASLRLSRTIVSSTATSEKNRAKTEISERILRWAAVTWSEQDLRDVELHIRNSAEFEAIGLALSSSVLPGAEAVGRFHEALLQVKLPVGAAGDTASIERHFIRGSLTGKIASMAKVWITAEDTIDLFVAILISELPDLSDRIKVAAAEILKETEERAASRTESDDEAPASSPT